jgi:hypothetical protein
VDSIRSRDGNVDSLRINDGNVDSLRINDGNRDSLRINDREVDRISNGSSRNDRDSKQMKDEKLQILYVYVGHSMRRVHANSSCGDYRLVDLAFRF